MTSSREIRAEVCRFVELNEKEVQVFPIEGLDDLQQQFGDRLIPGLIECLNDGHPEIRQFVVALLCLARDESAIPALIERFDDDDCRVVEILLRIFRLFGPAGAGAIPKLEPWLDSPNECLRLQAAIAIVALDPSRSDMKARIWEATTSEDRAARNMARLHFGQKPDYGA